MMKAEAGKMTIYGRRRKNTIIKKKKILLGINNGISKNVESPKLSEIKIKSTKKEQKNGKFSKFELPEQDLSFAVYSTAFPVILLSDVFVEQKKQMIQDLISDISDGNRIPGLIYMIYEAGYCKVKVADIFSKKWIIEIISKLIYEDLPLVITSITRIPKCNYITEIPGNVINDTKFLTSIAHQNKGIDTGRWFVKSKLQTDSGFFAALEVDAVSAHKIDSLGNMLNFGTNQIMLGFDQITGHGEDG